MSNLDTGWKLSSVLIKRSKKSFHKNHLKIYSMILLRQISSLMLIFSKNYRSNVSFQEENKFASSLIMQQLNLFMLKKSNKKNKFNMETIKIKIIF